jgi:hypothetical protein
MEKQNPHKELEEGRKDVEKVKIYSIWSQKVLAGSCKFGMGIKCDLLPTTTETTDGSH